MKKRLYQRTEPVYSQAENKGHIFAHNIHGENTIVHFIERLQKEGVYNGHRWENEQLIITVNFLDFGYSMTMKSKSTDLDEALYVEYGHSLMEQDSLEEFYKNALLIASIHLAKTIQYLEEEYEKYKQGKHCWPLTKDTVDEHLKQLNRQKEILATIDVKQEDLKYINGFLNK